MQTLKLQLSFNGRCFLVLSVSAHFPCFVLKFSDEICICASQPSKFTCFRHNHPIKCAFMHAPGGIRAVCGLITVVDAANLED